MKNLLETFKKDWTPLKWKRLFIWYDLWIGAFWDRDNRKLYIFPLPTLGFSIKFRTKPLYVHNPKTDPIYVWKHPMGLKIIDGDQCHYIKAHLIRENSHVLGYWVMWEDAYDDAEADYISQPTLMNERFGFDVHGLYMRQVLRW